MIPADGVDAAGAGDHTVRRERRASIGGAAVMGDSWCAKAGLVSEPGPAGCMRELCGCHQLQRRVRPWGNGEARIHPPKKRFNIKLNLHKQYSPQLSYECRLTWTVVLTSKPRMCGDHTHHYSPHGAPLRERGPGGPSLRRGSPGGARTPSRTAFPQFGRASMAVAEGFEPSVSLPTLAFEASSFGRSDTLPRESLDHGGPWKEIGSQGARKKDVRTLAHSCSRTPWMTSGRWFRRRSRTTSQREPAAPAFSSRAP